VSTYPGRGLHGETVRQLGLRIVGGQYPTGALIDPEALETELGVSKTVVREALRVLGAKGLVDSRPKRGTFVRERDEWSLLDTDVMQWRRQAAIMDEQFADDLAEVREIVEPAAARLAARRRTEDDLDRLEAALALMEAAHKDADRAIEADLKFHLALLKSAHNELLTRMDVVLISALDVRDRLVHQPGDGWRDPVPRHRILLDAVRSGDPDAASTAANHLLVESDADLRRRVEPPAAAPSRRGRSRRPGPNDATTR
jgi:DNA-binding FadR family transcriptional regulator